MKGLIKYHFKPEPEIQKLVENYYIQNHRKTEGERIENAERTSRLWEEMSATPIIGVFDLFDYWYWIYIYSLDYHINADGSLYQHNWSQEREIYIESFKDDDENKSSDLLRVMFEVLAEKGLELPSGKKDTRYLSREDSDFLIENTQKEVLEKLGFSNCKHKHNCNCPIEREIKHITMEVFLQAYSLGLWGDDEIMTHMDGYRLRADGVVSTIFGGHSKYGGVSYFDSFWKGASFDCLISRFIIQKKKESQIFNL